MKWFWGLIILFIGILFLGANLGWWNDIAWINLWQFWPLIFILFGVSLLVKRWRFGWIIILVTFLISLWLVFSNLTNIPQRKSWINFRLNNNRSTQSYPFSEDLSSNIKSADITIKAGASDINLASSSDKLIDGSLESVYELSLKVNTEEDKAIVSLKLEKLYRWMGWYKNSLDVKVTDKVPVKLTFDAGASKIDLDLANIILSKLDLNAGASTIDLKIGSKTEDNAEINIDAGASSIHLAVAKELGIQVKTKTGLSNKKFNKLNQIDSDTFESDNFTSAIKKIKIFINAGASSISLDLI